MGALGLKALLGSICLTGAGFTTNGIAGGSLAAWIQSAIMVTAGSCFAILQSCNIQSLQVSSVFSFEVYAITGTGCPFSLYSRTYIDEDGLKRLGSGD